MFTFIYVIMNMISLLTSRAFVFPNKNYNCKNYFMREISMRKLNRIEKMERMEREQNMYSNVYYPKNKNQVKYVNYLNCDDVQLVIALGAAGTGKTLFACLKSISLLKNNEINKIVITRPAISVEEEHGFLPGNIDKKMEPWMKPIFDIFDEFYSKSEINDMVKNKIIEISPLAYMRGRTFKNTFIICDEMQNSSPNQMLMLTTRLGTKSKMVITGDLNQSDKSEHNGLKDLYERVKLYHKGNMIKYIEFGVEDVERSEIVKEILDIYNRDKYSAQNITDYSDYTHLKI